MDEPGGRVSPPSIPLLSDMGVSHVVPNRICSNAMLAALARAKPAQFQLVSSSQHICARLKYAVNLCKPPWHLWQIF